MVFYIRAVNHSSMLCIFPMAVWLAEQPGGVNGGGMCCGARPGTEGLTGRLGQRVAGLLRGPGGAYLNQSPVWTIALKHCYCTAAA